jgi:hypothetical protein
MRRTALVAAALGVAAGPALAAYGSSLAITGLHYTLIDLAPDDGVAPSITFRDGLGSFAGGNFTSDPFGSVSYGSTDRGGAVSASVRWQDGALGMFASGVMAPEALGQRFAPYVTGASTFSHGLWSVLSPHTRIVWTADYKLDAWSTLDAGGDSFLRSVARVDAHFFSENGDPGEVFVTRIARASSDPRGGAQFGHNEGVLSFVYTNAADYTVGLRGEIETVVRGKRMFTSPVSPIPEPSTYALFAAGLAVVGVVTRRRAGKA